MRYLKKYLLFKEEAEFDPQVTDAPDLRMSKEKLNTLMKQISEFKEKKPLLDQAYLKIEDDKALDNKVKEILGPEVSSREDRNPFLVEYLNVTDLKRRLDKVQKDNANDKLKLDDFNNELKSATDSKQKASISQKLDEINKRMGLTNSTISKLKSDIINAEKVLKDKMTKQEKDMKDYIKKMKLQKY